MPQPNGYVMPEVPAEAIGPVTHETLSIAGHTLRMVRPQLPDRLLDLGMVAEAYKHDEYMPYWATLWPVSKYLMQALLGRPWASGLSAVELGCGLGLPGVAALLAGFKVTFTDYDQTALRFAAENASLNGFPGVRTLTLDWRHPLTETFDLIIASDLLYERRNVTPLVAAFQAMLAPNGVVMLADQNRAYAEEFRLALTAAGFSFTLRPFHEAPSEGREVSGSVYHITQAPAPR